jgi:predicted transcriptional regulator
MTPHQTISWIFLATAMTSGRKPAEVTSISNAADAINHAVPTEEEIQSSLTWLIAKGLVNKTDNKYGLTKLGKQEYKEASKKTTVLLKIWSSLETRLKRYPA